uniref:Uncharacterized protein n=1 Tax=Timema shepardi TaxID=629360 RepID=A0A7R9AXP5_TIMSH|nr:unnamed protein product [Timema shepardi]
MSRYTYESRLAVLYLASTLLSIVTTVCTLVPYEHWREILDVCVDVRCNCMLYGSDTFNFFTGGSRIFCLFVVFASAPALVVGMVMAGYHGYRVCISARHHTPNGRKSKSLRNGEVAVVKPQNENPEMTTPICQCWTMVALLGITIGLLILAAAIILTDGYVKTCNEYRKTLVKTLPTTGLATKVIYNRLSCSSILDFMDYLEPTTRPFRRRENFDYSRPYEERDFTRGDFINTAASLLLAIFTSWINCALWGLIVIHNFVLAKLARSRNTGI